MNVRACLLVSLLLVPVATPPASAADARAPAHRRVVVPPVKLENPAPAGAKGSASLNGTAIRVTSPAGINGTQVRPRTPSLNGASIGARR
jgi:hypothetical protein